MASFMVDLARRWMVEHFIRANFGNAADFSFAIFPAVFLLGLLAVVVHSRAVQVPDSGAGVVVSS